MTVATTRLTGSPGRAVWMEPLGGVAVAAPVAATEATEAEKGTPLANDSFGSADTADCRRGAVASSAGTMRTVIGGVVVACADIANGAPLNRVGRIDNNTSACIASASPNTIIQRRRPCRFNKPRSWRKPRIGPGSGDANLSIPSIPDSLRNLAPADALARRWQRIDPDTCHHRPFCHRLA